MTRHARLLGTAALLALAACGGEPAAPEAAAPVEAPAEAAQTADEEMLALAERHAKAVIAASPEAATALGLGEDMAGEGYAARLGDYSPLAREEAAALTDRFIRELRQIDRAALTGTAAVTHDVLTHAYRMAAERAAFDYGGAASIGSASPYPVTQLSGPHIGLPRLFLSQQPLEDAADADAYLARLSDMARALSETTDSVLLDAEGGVVPPAFALEGAARSIRGLTEAPAAEHPLVGHLASAAAKMDLGAGEASRLEAEAARILEAEVYPAYDRLEDTLSSLVAAAGEDAGVWRLDGGDEFYAHALESYGAGDMTPAEVHELGLSEVARISAEMNAIMDTLDVAPAETAGLRFASLAEDPALVYPNTDEAKEELLEELRAQVEAIQALAPDWFGTLPPQPVEVSRIPTYEQDSAPGGYYTGPSLDGTRPGIYWINLKDTADWPKYTLKTLTYHEAVPGHHFQIALQQDVGDMPLIRQMMYLSEFGEGWALYAEKVADEVGMYEGDPLGQLGRLQSELFRAARLVVDTGLHDKRWTREEAIDYMVEATGETRASVTREIERYSVWPGQATSYKLGQIKIRELRTRAEEALGDGFDIKAFHDLILLDGSVPLPVLEKKVDAWIEAQTS